MALKDVLAELERAHAAGALTRYALGGAVAATFYLEPMFTEDVEVFVTLGTGPASSVVTLDPIYSYFKARGATVEGERLEIVSKFELDRKWERTQAFLRENE